ncbi:MAG: RNA-binding transcriptional accessory protein [Saprospiraceae bacterium]|nr:RNA-binding transcriptional accessory protein [Saprospiraceae bacterium]
MSETLIQSAAGKLGIPIKTINSVHKLFSDGATIPFIARYRKEVTGGLDEVILQRIESTFAEINELEKRRDFIKSTIREQNRLTDQLEQALDRAADLTTLEDLYLPYKKKRKTRATVAREMGLEPLADQLWKQDNSDPKIIAKSFITAEIKSVDEALSGASDILAEHIAELPWVRQSLRNDYQRHGTLKSTVIKSKEKEGIKYSDYFSTEEKIARCPSHRLLAILRGENEGILRTQIAVDEERSLYHIKRKIIRQNNRYHSFLENVIEESFKRLIAPSLENETKNFFKEKADKVAIDIFAQNLRQLLLAPPVGEKNILAIDPGFRTGCKLVVLNRQGDLLFNSTIFPNPPQNEVRKSVEIINELCGKFEIEAIAIGNGTAGRETMDLIKQNSLTSNPEIFLVNESGASIYSASDVAREEFPDYDVTVRGAVSIGRRLMDPLAELVKIDPKSIGVGQYQHDVNQRSLQESLENTVSSCVNLVGVNLNTASKHLLQHISGLGITLAQNIVDYRKDNGPFRERKELLNVPRLGAKVYEQCAGFLRIRNGKNPLDNTGVHPESYPLVDQMARDLNTRVTDLIENSDYRKKIDLKNYITEKTGLPTLKDIISELDKPGLDPRGKAKVFEFHQGIKSIDDLEIGMQVPGLVTNNTKFGSFVNIGVKQDGLIHISQTGGETLYLDDQILVKILDVDIARNRINLKFLERII